MDFIRKNKNYIIWAGCALIAIACFLTFVKYKAYGMTDGLKFNELAKEFNKGDGGKVITGYVVLVAAIASAVLVYLKKTKFSLISTGIALFVTFFDYFKVKDQMDELSKLGAKVSYVAPWIVLLGVIAAVVPIVLTWKDEETKYYNS